MTFWYAVALIGVAAFLFMAVYWAGSAVLRKTVRDYLISTVETNVDQIQYAASGQAEREGAEANSMSGEILLEYGSGRLRIDDDFMNVVNDVQTALYTSDGTMIYGENPVAKETEAVPFTVSRTWNVRIGKIRYDGYDRKLNLRTPDGSPLWIRGIVAETENVQQMREISGLMLLVLPVLVLLALIAGYFLTGKMLAPIREIEQTAGRISEGSDLGERIDLGPGTDELHRLADVFNSMFDRLSEAFAAEQRFTSDASHELRTPLSVILVQCEVILEEEHTSEEYMQAIRTIRRQGARMNGLINDMLDYTRMEQRSEQYEMTQLDLSGLTAETAESLALLQINGITLEMEIEPGIMINGNRFLLLRLLQNLISNAYRYGKKDGVIEVRLARDHVQNTDVAVLSVKDDGIGIAEEEQSRIFDRFYRSDASRSVQGTGLGLSMVQKIADLHGAEITVESAPGEGSCFSVRFHSSTQDTRDSSHERNA